MVEDQDFGPVLRTLRAMTGRDYGDTADEWRLGLRRGAWSYLFRDRAGG